MIICEVGLNHMGDLTYANEYINKIIKSKADGVIFHIREKFFYKNLNKKFLLPQSFYKNLLQKLHKHNIKLGIALADPTKIDFCESIGIDFYKIFSRDICDVPLISAIKKTQKLTFVATGMSDFKDIEKFTKLIYPYKKNFTIIQTQLNLNTNFTNLKSILLLKQKFHMNVAYGNHAKNTNVLFTAIAFEPSDIIFYVKGNKVRKHVDNPHAIPLKDLSIFIKNLKELPSALGDGKKIRMKHGIK